MTTDPDVPITIDVLTPITGDIYQRRGLSLDSTTTYALADAQTATVVLKHGEVLATLDLADGQTTSYYYRHCGHNGNNYARQVRVVNRTGQTLDIGVYSHTADHYSSFDNLEPDGERVFRNIKAGKLRFHATDAYDWWHSHDDYYVEICGDIEFVWTDDMVYPNWTRPASEGDDTGACQSPAAQAH